MYHFRPKCRSAQDVTPHSAARRAISATIAWPADRGGHSARRVVLTGQKMLKVQGAITDRTRAGRDRGGLGRRPAAGPGGNGHHRRGRPGPGSGPAGRRASRHQSQRGHGRDRRPRRRPRQPPPPVGPRYRARLGLARATRLAEPRHTPASGSHGALAVHATTTRPPSKSSPPSRGGTGCRSSGATTSRPRRSKWRSWGRSPRWRSGAG